MRESAVYILAEKDASGTDRFYIQGPDCLVTLTRFPEQATQFHFKEAAAESRFLRKMGGNFRIIRRDFTVR